MNAQPHAHVRFRRAIERRALWLAEDAARELRTCRSRTRCSSCISTSNGDHQRLSGGEAVACPLPDGGPAEYAGCGEGDGESGEREPEAGALNSERVL